MYKILRFFLFFLPAEKAHHLTTGAFKFIWRFPGVSALLKQLYAVNDPRLQQQVLGLTFKNPVGLAAGFDKNAEYINEFPSLGFGFLEIGTVTPQPQPGNDQPRLFRLKADHALINRMGFNNKGLDYAKEKLKQRSGEVIIGGNIGKNKVTPNENAVDDYIKCFQELFDFVDYFVVNVSSPNTPNLRALQDKKPLTALLEALVKENLKMDKQKPILLKIAPDLSNEQLDDIIDILNSVSIDGLIATNTTIDRSGLATDRPSLEAIGAGGLSGAPLQSRSTEVIQYIRSKNKSIVIIAVGGIYDEKSALEKWEAGANLLQLYTGFIYEGPAIIKRINKAILHHLEEG